MSAENDKVYEFGPFALDTASLALYRNGELIPLAPKSTELLTFLLERQGEVVSKQEIFDHVWADTFVEDGVLTQNIYSIRKALGTMENGGQFIENVPRRGYRFVAKVHFRRNESESGRHVEKEQGDARPDRNSAISWKLIAAFALVLAVATGGYLLLRRSSATVGVPANLQFQKITDTGDIFFPTLSPSGDLVAYCRGSLAENFYVKDLRTGEERKLLADGITSFGFSQFSNDGKYIYVRTRSVIFVPADVVRIPITGGKPQLMATDVWGHFSLSPNETQMTFVRFRPNENRQAVIVKDLKSGAEKEVSTRSAPLDYYLRAFPAWSPDATKLAVVTQRSRFQYNDLTIIDLKLEKETSLDTGDLSDVQQAVWLAGGNELAVSARIKKNFQLWKIPFPNGEITPITNDLASHRFLSVTADRKKLLTMEVVYYSNIWTANSDDLNAQAQLTFGTSRNDGYFGIDWVDNENMIYTTNNGVENEWNLLLTNGAEPQQLTQAKVDERNDFPQTTPDSQYVFFNSNRNGAFNIWRSRIDGSEPEQITFGESGQQFYPQISPDGEWLYFIKKLERSSAVWRRSLTTGVEEELTSERYSPAEFLSMSPDGKYLAFHNLTAGADLDASDPIFRVGVLGTDDKQVRIYKLKVAPGRIHVYWTPDSKAFVYDSFTTAGTELWRHPIDENGVPEVMFALPKARLFFVDWSKDGKKIAFSRGEQLHNALLLTNFE